MNLVNKTDIQNKVGSLIDIRKSQKSYPIITHPEPINLNGEDLNRNA